MVKPRLRHAARALLPGLAVLAGYRRQWLRGDLIAGITVAAQRCALVFAAGDRHPAGGVLVFQRGEDTLRWRLGP